MFGVTQDQSLANTLAPADLHLRAFDAGIQQYRAFRSHNAITKAPSLQTSPRRIIRHHTLFT
jgi:hypothetical protein